MIKTWSTSVREEEKTLVPCNLCGKEKFRKALHCEGFSYVRCNYCNLVQINPQPHESEIQKRYGEDYLNYELGNEEVFLQLQLLALKDAGFYEIEKELLEKEPSDNASADNTSVDNASADNASADNRPKVLDIGSALGTLLAKLRDNGWHSTGVEISEAQAEYSRSRFKLDIHTLKLSDNNFPDEQFNVILASHLIEHLNDPSAFLGEAFRILSPGGYIFITTPNISGLQAKLFKNKWRSAIFDHLYLFSKKNLSSLLVKNGFKVERISTWGGLAKGAGPAFLKRFLDKAAKKHGFGDVMIIRAKKI